MKFKGYMINEASKNVQSMLNFIMSNKQFIEYDHQVQDLWERVAVAKFKKDTGFYPTVTRWKWEIADLSWVLENTDKMEYDEILKNFKEFSSKTTDSPEEMKEKTAFTSLLQYANFDGKGTFKGIRSYDLNTFIWFLQYIVNGKLDQNLANANDIIDEYLRPKEGVVRSVEDFRNVKLPLGRGSVTMSRLKNGKIIVKGLNGKQLAHITKIIDMVSKFHR